MRPETYRLARIEPREELAVHLLPWQGSHGFCGVNIWDECKVEPTDYNADYLSIAEFLDELRSGEIDVGKLTCERCVAALSRKSY